MWTKCFRHEVFHGLLKHLVYGFIIVWTVAIAVLPGPRFVKRVVSFGVIVIDVVILVRSEKLDNKWTSISVPRRLACTNDRYRASLPK